MIKLAKFRWYGIELEQHELVHKIGTDALAISKWAYLASAQRILDIGTGSGIIALSLAQKHPEAQVVAIEPQEEAFDLAQRNFISSAFASNIQCILTNLEGYTQANFAEPGDVTRLPLFDLIVSNPPYYAAGTPSANAVKSFARRMDSLPPNQLFQCVHQLLSSSGQLWVIIPSTQVPTYHQAACIHGLYFNLEVTILHTEHHQPINRTIVVYSRNALLFGRYTWSIGDELPSKLW
jgi:tRNA1Val (adenine37-N6)-methyltransferase